MTREMKHTRALDHMRRAYPRGIAVGVDVAPTTAEELVRLGRASWTDGSRREVRLNEWERRISGT